MKLIKSKKSIEKKNTNARKKIVLSFLLGAIIFGTIGVSAASLLYSKDVTYDNSTRGLNSTTVQDALDELYEQAKNAPNCDSNGVCTVECPNGTIYETISNGYKFKNFPLNVKTVTTGDGLYSDRYESGRYVYVNNYITFNNEIWRIISLENDGTIKIIKEADIGNWRYYAEEIGTSFTDSTISADLNNYYNSLSTTTKSYIQEHNFNVGTISSDYNQSLFSTIDAEKKTTWTGNIALANVSDVIKSISNIYDCEFTQNVTSQEFNCYDKTYFKEITNGFDAWLLSYSAEYMFSVWYFGFNQLTIQSQYDFGTVHPVLFLKSDITLSGSGTQSDPYIIN